VGGLKPYQVRQVYGSLAPADTPILSNSSSGSGSEPEQAHRKQTALSAEWMNEGMDAKVWMSSISPS